MKDYLGELKSSHLLIERIKDYYKSQGIPTYNMKFTVLREMDHLGNKLYSIRSNLVYNVKEETLTTP
jgi:hypothetical protein